MLFDYYFIGLAAIGLIGFAMVAIGVYKKGADYD